MKIIIITGIILSTSLLSCKPHNQTQTTDNQSPNTNSELIVDDIIQSEKQIESLDLMTSEIDSLMAELEQMNDSELK